MMLQAEFIRGLVFVIAAAMMMASNAFSQVISDSDTQEINGSALRTPNATASSDRLIRSRRPSLVVTTANGRRVVVGLKKPGLRSRWKNSDRTTRGSLRAVPASSAVADNRGEKNN